SAHLGTQTLGLGSMASLPEPLGCAHRAHDFPISRIGRRFGENGEIPQIFLEFRQVRSVDSTNLAPPARRLMDQSDSILTSQYIRDGKEGWNRSSGIEESRGRSVACGILGTDPPFSSGRSAEPPPSDSPIHHA